MTALEQTRLRQIQVRRVVLVALAGILWAFGWCAGKTVLAVLWVGAAVKIGWTDSRATLRRR